ncbi:uncharacterized protein LOC121379221 [Gigantopelta aegis]|uniref:uncharacterized protein LOC121379221 n=1 Tax=Gigantopelta aegis TaxID=1735272 RepID=UPI001B88C3AA|nr:uncharacterized protein LOC121379221 [Gigantopelta aegis]
MDKFDELSKALAETGMTVSAGWRHVRLHHGTSRKEIYRAMYGQLVYGGHVGKPGKTLVFPDLIREVVRERFPEAGAGVYDDQYRSGGTHVTLKQMAEFQWHQPPKTCGSCSSSK